MNNSPEKGIIETDTVDESSHEEPGDDAGKREQNQHEVIYFPGAEPTSEPKESAPASEEQVLLEDSIILLEADLQEIVKDRAFLQLSLSEMTGMYKEQARLNQQILNITEHLNKLQKELQVVGNDKTYFRKRIRQQGKYDLLAEDVKNLVQQKSELFAKRKNENGEMINLWNLGDKIRQTEKDLGVMSKKMQEKSAEISALRIKLGFDRNWKS